MINMWKILTSSCVLSIRILKSSHFDVLMILNSQSSKLNKKVLQNHTDYKYSYIDTIWQVSPFNTDVLLKMCSKFDMKYAHFCGKLCSKSVLLIT